MARKKTKSPTERSLVRLRKEGWQAQVVERWNPHAMVRSDLFGIIDVLAIRAGSAFTLGVQACAASGVSGHVKKLVAAPSTRVWLDPAAGRLLQIHGWALQASRGKKKKWRCRRVSIRIVDDKVVAHELPPVESL